MPKKVLEESNCVDFRRYDELSGEKQDLIRYYHREAKAALNTDRKTFQSFILAWIAFNAMATCITDVDRDDKLISTLSQAKNLDNEFRNLLESDQQFKECVDKFRRTWPIANVLRIRQFERVASKSLHGKDLSKTDKDTLKLWGLKVEDDVIYDWSIVDQQFHEIQNKSDLEIKGKDIFAPVCWIKHRGQFDKIDCNWANSIQSIYRVRCNIFHSDKSPLLERNQEIVFTSLQVLLRITDYFLSKVGAVD